MTKKERAASVVAALKNIYPNAECALLWSGEPWKLLVMGMLSAQCTDKRVNEVSRTLFAKYPTPQDMANSDIAELGEAIRSCGLWQTKAKNLRAACSRLVTLYGGELPADMDELLTFEGVGRKIANLLLGDVFGMPAIVCDTHCIRLSGRIGFVSEDEKNPARIEAALRKLILPGESSDFCHRLVLFGREVCTARSPSCNSCPISKLCRYGSKLKQG